MSKWTNAADQYELDQLRRMAISGNPNANHITDRIRQLEDRIRAEEIAERMAPEKQRVPFSIRENARAQVAQHVGRSMDDILARVMEARRRGVQPDQVDQETREEIAAFRREQERRLASQVEPPALTASQIQAIGIEFRTVPVASAIAGEGTVLNDGAVLRALHKATNPAPKKPVEIPILTFGKRRINLKDVA